MYKSIYILPKLDSPDDDRVQGIIQAIHKIADSLDVPIVYEIDNTTLVIAVGGDGTMLEAKRKAAAAGAIAMGINLGKVGFLTDFVSDHGVISHALRGAYANLDMFYLEERIGISILPNEQYPNIVSAAFNEYVVSSKQSDYIISYEMFIGDMYAGSHRATSLIIGVPTGSTAYSLSAGGALILPSMSVFQIIPVAPLSMTSRPIIVPSNIPIKILFNVNNRKNNHDMSFSDQPRIAVRADGVEVINSHSPLELTFIQNKNKVKLLHHKDWNFFNMLTEKLGWKNS